VFEQLFGVGLGVVLQFGVFVDNRPKNRFDIRDGLGWNRLGAVSAVAAVADEQTLSERVDRVGRRDPELPAPLVGLVQH